MSVNQVTKDYVKSWVVKNAKVTNPYRKKWWYASVTIGYDYNEKGETIERAYQNLADFIFKSPFIMCQLSDFESFRKIVKSK